MGGRGEDTEGWLSKKNQAARDPRDRNAGCQGFLQ